MTKERKTRKPRADSKEQAVVAMIHADRKIDPPDDVAMNSEQLAIFREIIDEFAKVDWSRHNIRLACYLARAMWALQEAQDELFGGGSIEFTQVNARGTETANPLVSICQNLSGGILSMRRSLALHATAGSSKRDVGKSRGINKSSENNAPEDNDGLIAKPEVA